MMGIAARDGVAPYPVAVSRREGVPARRRDDMPITKSEARELMSRGYEMGATVLNGVVRRREDGIWTVDDKPVGEWLSTVQGEEVTIVLATVVTGRGRKQVCRICGSEFEGYECPRCRQARQRLRNRL
jgi:hypothetical protein